MYPSIKLMVFMIMFQLAYAYCVFDSCNSWCQGNNYQYGACHPITAPNSEQSCRCIGAKGNYPRD